MVEGREAGGTEPSAQIQVKENASQLETQAIASCVTCGSPISHQRVRENEKSIVVAVV